MRPSAGAEGGAELDWIRGAPSGLPATFSLTSNHQPLRAAPASTPYQTNPAKPSHTKRPCLGAFHLCGHFPLGRGCAPPAIGQHTVLSSRAPAACGAGASLRAFHCTKMNDARGAPAPERSGQVIITSGGTWPRIVALSCFAKRESLFPMMLNTGFAGSQRWSLRR